MFIGSENINNQYLTDRIGEIPNINIISFYDNLEIDELEISTTLHNVLIFPIIDSYDEVEYSAIGWKCAITSAFEGLYTVTSIFMVSPTESMLDDCIKIIKKIDDNFILDNVWLWPEHSEYPKRETDPTKLPYQTKKVVHH